MSTDIEPVTIMKLAERSGWKADQVADANVLITQRYIREVSPLHHLKLERVMVAVPPQGEWESEDLYTMQGKLAPTKHLLERIALLAGVKWDVGRCRFDVLTADCVIFTAVGGLRSPSGEIHWQACTREWNREVEQAEIDERAATLKKWEGSGQNRRSRPATPEEQDAYRRTEMARSLKHRVSMTETKARLRVLRALLGIRGAAGREYWTRDFFVPRVDIRIDASDPGTRERILDEALGARRALGYDEPTPGAEQPVVDDAEPEIVDVEATEVDEPTQSDFPPPRRDPMVIAQAGDVTIPESFGDWAGTSVADAWEAGPEGMALVTSIAKLPTGVSDTVRDAARIWVDAAELG